MYTYCPICQTRTTVHNTLCDKCGTDTTNNAVLTCKTMDPQTVRNALTQHTNPDENTQFAIIESPDGVKVIGTTNIIGPLAEQLRTAELY